MIVFLYGTWILCLVALLVFILVHNRQYNACADIPKLTASSVDSLDVYCFVLE